MSSSSSSSLDANAFASALYAKDCAACHGATGEGSGPFPSLRKKWDSAKLASEVKGMVAKYGNCGAVAQAECEKAVANYINKEFGNTANSSSPTSSSQSSSSASSEFNQLAFGADRYKAGCEGCHGPKGAGHNIDRNWAQATLDKWVLKMMDQYKTNCLTVTKTVCQQAISAYIMAKFPVIASDIPFAKMDLSTSELPSLIQAEDYSAFFDTTSGNQFAVYREDDVDVEETTDVADSDGGYELAAVESGEWLEYPVTVTQDGKFVANIRVAGLVAGGMFTLEVDGSTIGSAVSVDGSGEWKTLVKDVGELKAGHHTIRVNVLVGGFKFNWLDVAISAVK